MCGELLLVNPGVDGGRGGGAQEGGLVSVRMAHINDDMSLLVRLEFH